MPECGCRIVTREKKFLPRDSANDWEIEYCPLRAAARKLREALKATSRFEKTDGKWHSRACRIMIDGACNRQSCGLINEALAETESTSVGSTIKKEKEN